MIRALLSVAMLLLLNAPVLAAPAFPERLQERDVWYGMVRNPDAAPPDSAFIANQIVARHRFARWFSGDDQKTDFYQAFKDSHVAVLTFTNYDKVTGALANPGQVNKGQLRRPDLLVSMKGLLFAPDSADTLTPLGVPLVEGVPAPEAGRILLTGIPDDVAPRNARDKFFGKTVTWHKLPKPADVERWYIPAMAELAQEMRALPVAKESQAKLLPKLALYYQIGINAHVFDGINNSLLMGQVNEILDHFGMKPMSHGFHDYAAFSLQQDAFAKYFTTQIDKAQTSAPTWPRGAIDKIFPEIPLYPTQRQAICGRAARNL